MAKERPLTQKQIECLRATEETLYGDTKFVEGYGRTHRGLRNRGMSTSPTQGSLFSPPTSTPARKESYDALGIRRPVTWWRQEILSGKLPWSAGSDAVRSWLTKDIYDGAVEIARLKYIEDRRAALGKLPVSIRPLVEEELRRVWAKQRDGARSRS